MDGEPTRIIYGGDCSHAKVLEMIPSSDPELIFVCQEIFITETYTRAVLKRIVRGDVIIRPDVFDGPGIYMLHIDSRAFGDGSRLLYDSTCVFVYDTISKYFRYGHMTTHDDTPFMIEKYN